MRTLCLSCLVNRFSGSAMYSDLRGVVLEPNRLDRNAVVTHITCCNGQNMQSYGLNLGKTGVTENESCVMTDFWIRVCACMCHPLLYFEKGCCVNVWPVCSPNSTPCHSCDKGSEGHDWPCYSRQRKIGSKRLFVSHHSEGVWWIWHKVSSMCNLVTRIQTWITREGSGLPKFTKKIQ